MPHTIKQNEVYVLAILSCSCPVTVGGRTGQLADIGSQTILLHMRLVT